MKNGHTLDESAQITYTAYHETMRTFTKHNRTYAMPANWDALTLQEQASWKAAVVVLHQHLSLRPNRTCEGILAEYA